MKNLHKHLVENKETLIAQKKAETKHADGVSLSAPIMKSEAFKSSGEDVLLVTAVINTTNWIDSHKDVHMPGIWTKSIQENKNILHVQEHKSNEFAKIISKGEDLKVFTRNYNWKDLGVDVNGTTQALVFESKVRKSSNPEMFERYKNGEVDNHSVGMRYVKILLAVDDENYPQEKEIYDTYYSEIANKDEIDSYFWVVKEAKIIEGSAVPLGSNVMTPTLQVEAAAGTSKSEPSKDTQTGKQFFKHLINQ